MSLKMFIACLLFATPAFGQALPIDHLTPALPTAGERRAADLASWGTVLASVVLDTKASWDAPDRQTAFIKQGIRVAITYGVVFGVKALVHRERPCAPACGSDNPEFSFYSAHTSLAWSTVGGGRLAFSIPLAVSTGGLRVAAGKHWLTDVLVGAGVGFATSRIR